MVYERAVGSLQGEVRMHRHSYLHGACLGCGMTAREEQVLLPEVFRQVFHLFDAELEQTGESAGDLARVAEQAVRAELQRQHLAGGR